MEQIINYNKSLFEDIKHVDNNGNEFWYARELQFSLNYTDWQKFQKVIDKAKYSCKLSNFIVNEHFVDIIKLIKSDSTTKRKIVDYKLSRHACYLIVQNADPRKKDVAKAQSYIAMRTIHNQQIQNEKIPYPKNLTELYSLNQPAKKAGVKNLDEFNNWGYKGLYGDENIDEIVKRKGLKNSNDILDHMDDYELAINIFRITHTEFKLKRDNIKTESEANKVHYTIGKSIRTLIKENGCPMPEELPILKRSRDLNILR